MTRLSQHTRGADYEPGEATFTREPWLLWQRVCSGCGVEFRRMAPQMRPPAYCGRPCLIASLKRGRNRLFLPRAP